MSDVIVIEKCSYCQRNLAEDRLNRNAMNGSYSCKDTDDCLNARSESVEPEVLRGEEEAQAPPFQRSVRFHYRQSSCSRMLAGMLVGFSVFVGSWIYAVKTYGWFFGLGLGWLPALFFGILAATYWPMAILVAVGILLFSR